MWAARHHRCTTIIELGLEILTAQGWSGAWSDVQGFLTADPA